MKRSMSLLSLLFLATSAFAGGGIIGSGGDGLDLSSQDALTTNVRVPVPADLLSHDGILRVTGRHGAEGLITFSVLRCETDATGTVKKFGCGSMHDYNINQDVVLAPGTYEVYYGETHLMTEVRQNRVTELRLREIRVPKFSHPVRFDVFYDFTDPATRAKFVAAVFTLAEYRDAYAEICKNPAPENQAACASALSYDPQAFSRNIVFKDDGTYSDWSFGTHEMKNRFRPWVATGLDSGDFISVLPGVYGMDFRSEETGEVKTVLGLRLE